MAKNLISLIAFLIFFEYAITKGITPNKVVIAINCGGSEYKDSNGIKYIDDDYFDKGSSSDHGLNYDIKGTKDMILYQTERWSPETMTYSIPLSIPGKYTFILKFSEVYFNHINEKVFDIALGSKKVVENLDIFKKVGRETAYDEYVEFELANNQIYYKGKKVSGAYDPDTKKVFLKFLKGKFDNPKINAILLIRGTINDTDYAEKKKAMDEINKKKNMENRKNYMLDLRHDPDEEYDESELLNSDSEDYFIKKDEGIFAVFKTAPGIGILVSVAVFFTLNYLIDF